MGEDGGMEAQPKTLLGWLAARQGATPVGTVTAVPQPRTAARGEEQSLWLSPSGRRPGRNPRAGPASVSTPGH
jgi:hypothetical protein